MSISFNVLELTRDIFVTHGGGQEVEGFPPSVLGFTDEVVPDESKSITLSSFQQCEGEQFERDNELEEELMGSLEESCEVEISYVIAYTTKDKKSSLIHLRTDDCYAHLEFFLIVHPNQWCAVIDSCSHPFILSNNFSYQGSDGSFAGFFEFVNRDSTFDELVTVAQRFYNEFCNDEHH